MAANFVFVNAADRNEDASGTQVGVLDFNTVEGNLLVVTARWDGGGLNDDATGTVSDTAGNEYELVGYATTGSASEDTKVGMWYCLSATAHADNNITVTLSAARTFKAMFAVQYSYDGTIELGDNGAGNSTSNSLTYTTSPALGAVTGDLVIGWFGAYNSGPPSFTPDSPFTLQSSLLYGKYIDYIVASGTSFTPSMTLTSPGDTYGAISAVFQEATGGGGNNYTLAADQGTYNVTGQAAELLTSSGLVAEYGSYSLLGSEAVRDIEMNAEQGEYDLTGQDVFLRSQPTLSAESGLYSLIGQAAAIIYSQAASIVRPKGQRRFYGFRLSR